MPPFGSAWVGRVWRWTMLTPWTTTRFSAGRTFRTWPVRPLSLPVRTMTLSPFLILAAMLQDLRSQRDDLHVVLGAQFTRNRAEDPGADRLVLLVDDDSGRLVEADDRAVRSEEHTSELQSREHLVCRPLLEKK